MSIHWNANAAQILARMVANTAAAVDGVCRDFSGRPVDEVRTALAVRWAASNDGAAITEPDLTNIATLIAQGKRVWVEQDGKIVAED